jgi:hypothetical protein
VKRKSVQTAVKKFLENVDEIDDFSKSVSNGKLSDEFVSWAHDYAVIKLYREFESLMFDALVGVINNDPAVLSISTGYKFPKQMSQNACRFIIVGTGYFNFNGRGGLKQNLKKFVGEQHYLVKIVMHDNYRDTLEKLSALRNFAAHNSQRSKEEARKATGQKGISSSGAWLKRKYRLQRLIEDLKNLAEEVYECAPY